MYEGSIVCQKLSILHSGSIKISALYLNNYISPRNPCKRPVFLILYGFLLSKLLTCHFKTVFTCITSFKPFEISACAATNFACSSCLILSLSSAKVFEISVGEVNLTQFHYLVCSNELMLSQRINYFFSKNFLHITILRNIINIWRTVKHTIKNAKTKVALTPLTSTC